MTNSTTQTFVDFSNVNGVYEFFNGKETLKVIDRDHKYELLEKIEGDYFWIADLRKPVTYSNSKELFLEAINRIFKEVVGHRG